MKKRYLIFAGISVFSALAGAGITGIAIKQKPKPEALPVSVQTTAVKAKDSAPQEDLIKELAALREKLSALQSERDKLLSERAALQRALSDRQKEQPKPDAAAAVKTEPEAKKPDARATFEERLAQLRDNPEVQKLRDSFRTRVQNLSQERASFLESVETSGMTPEQRADHEKLIALENEIVYLTDQLPKLTGEEASAARRKLMQNFFQLGPLYEKERRYLLEATGRAIGYNNDDASVFADQIQMIYQQTSLIPPQIFNMQGTNARTNSPSGNERR